MTIPLLDRALAKLSEPIPQVRIRADGAFFDHKIVELIEEKGGSYVIVARLSGPLKNRLSGLRYRQVSPGMWATEFRYCPQGWPGPRRFVVIRRPVPEEPSAQLHLFQMDGYSYQVLVTNLSLTALHLWRFYNQRARAELIIRELKEVYALGKIPTKDSAVDLQSASTPICSPLHVLNSAPALLRADAKLTSQTGPDRIVPLG